MIEFPVSWIKWDVVKRVNWLANNKQTVHDLKVLPQYFYDVKSGKKQFEVRKDDRDYRVDDFLFLHNFDGNSYLDDEPLLCKVTYKLPGGRFGIEEGYCVLGIELV